MLCEQCREREATVHLTKVFGREAAQHHLCEVCHGEGETYTKRSCAKPYKVVFWDRVDGSWSGLGWVFDDLSEAIGRCEQMQGELAQGNKDGGEHYGVIDLDAGQEIYCAAQHGAPSYAKELFTLRFLVEPAFRGSIELRLDRTRGMDLLVTNGIIFIPVPGDRHVLVKTFAPLQHDFRLSGQYTSGVEVPGAASFLNVPPADTVVIDGGGHLGGTGYPQEGVYVFFVGNEQDRKGSVEK